MKVAALILTMFLAAVSAAGQARVLTEAEFETYRNASCERLKGLPHVVTHTEDSFLNENGSPVLSTVRKTSKGLYLCLQPVATNDDMVEKEFTFTDGIRLLDTDASLYVETVKYLDHNRTLRIVETTKYWISNEGLRLKAEVITRWTASPSWSRSVYEYEYAANDLKIEAPVK